MTKALREILSTIGTEWSLVPTRKHSLSAVYDLYKIDRFRLTVKNGYLYIKIDPKIYFGKWPDEYMTFYEAMNCLDAAGKQTHGFLKRK